MDGNLTIVKNVIALLFTTLLIGGCYSTSLKTDSSVAHLDGFEGEYIVSNVSDGISLDAGTLTIEKSAASDNISYVAKHAKGPHYFDILKIGNFYYLQLSLTKNDTSIEFALLRLNKPSGKITAYTETGVVKNDSVFSCSITDDDGFLVNSGSQGQGKKYFLDFKGKPDKGLNYLKALDKKGMTCLVKKAFDLRKKTKQEMDAQRYSQEPIKDYLDTILFQNSKLIVYPEGPITYRISDPEESLTPSQHKIIDDVLKELAKASRKRFIKKSAQDKNKPPANLVLYFTEKMEAFSKSYSFHSMLGRDFHSRLGIKLPIATRERAEKKFAKVALFSFSIPDKKHNEFIADGYVVTDLSKIAQYNFKKELLKQISMVLIRGKQGYKKREPPVPTIFSSVPGKHNVDHLSDVDRAFLQVIYSGKIAAGTSSITARRQIRDRMLKLMPDIKAAVSVSAEPSSYNFEKGQKIQNDAGELQAVLYDFMLAKYSPEKLDQNMLEAMLSSRWAYEKQETEPVGGRFFNKGSGTPSYAQVQKLTGQFKQWLIAGAKKLANDFILDIPLFYGNKTVASGSICIKLDQPVNAPVRGSQLDQVRKVSMCKDNNAQAVNLFNQCEEAYLDIKKAKAILAREEKNGCKPVGRTSRDVNTEGPCNFPKDMEPANISQEIKKCMADNCGATPTTIEGIQSYQSCVKLFSNDMKEQLQTLLEPAENGSSQADNVDTCTPQKNNIKTYRKRINRYQCSLHGARPEAVNCETLADNEPENMRVIRLDISNNKKCDSTWVFNRATKRSARLLSNGRPNRSSTLDLSFVIDGLDIPYTPSFKVSNKIPNARATVHLNVLGINEKNSKTQTISLNSKITDVNYEAVGN